VLDRLIAERRVPEAIAMDNGPELTGRTLDRWAYEVIGSVSQQTARDTAEA
jgi:hypothetical protein